MGSNRVTHGNVAVEGGAVETIARTAAASYLCGMRPEDLLTPMPSGLCCPAGDFHIDPTRPAERAVITHGHSDHARSGHGAVLATPETLDLMRLRYGEGFAGTTQAIRYGERITHYYQARGIALGELRAARDAKKAELAGAIALCPPSALQEIWSRRFPDPVSAFASGWMRVRARARQRGVELPLVISDHADWDGLIATITATGASEIWVTHGQEDALARWRTLNGRAAQPLQLVGY